MKRIILKYFFNINIINLKIMGKILLTGVDYMSEKNNYIIPGIVCTLLAVCVSMLFMTDSFRKDEANADNSSFRHSETIHNTTYKFPGGEDKMYLKEITLDDKSFLQDEYKYNHQLAKASLALSLSAFTSDDGKSHWGDDGNFNRDINIKQVLSDLKFEKSEVYGYDVNLNDSSSKVAFALGHKTLNNGDKSFDVVCVAVRGGGYGCEWADNFRLGSDQSSFHKGFFDSAQKIVPKLDDYIKRRCKGENVKLWITGYSRGGAVANILASLYDSEKENNGCSVYAYTFASPATADISNDDNVKYSNIFNIINPYDIVPTIPPSQWGFSRFGVDLYFPMYDEQNELFSKVSSYYTDITGVNKELFKESPLKSVTDIIVKIGKDRKTYASLLQPVLEDLVLSSMTREKIDGKWTVIPFKKYVRQKYGAEIASEIDSIEKNIGLTGVGDITITLPRDFVKFLTLCKINGVGDISTAISESMTLGTAHEIAGLGGESIFSGSVSGHFPEVYLAWMETIGENEFVK